MSDGATTMEAGARAAEAAGEGAAEDRFLHLAGVRGEPEFLERARREAWRRHMELPMPSTKSEEWRYTDIQDLDLHAFEPLLVEGDEAEGDGEVTGEIPAPLREVLERSAARSAVRVEVDGSARHHRTDPGLESRGVVFAPIRRVARERPELLVDRLFASEVAPWEEKLWSLHVALLTGGYLLYVPEGVRVEEPVHVLRHLEREGALLATHSLIVAEEGAEVTLIDEFRSPDLAEGSLSLNGTEVFGGDGAVVRYLSLELFGRGVHHFGVQHVTTGRDASVLGFNVSLGGDLARTDVTSHLLGPGGESEMLALWFGGDDQHFDYHTLQHHGAPSARSDLLYKGALEGRAESVFRGLIRVDRGAQLTDAYQTNRNLLLSRACHATTLPNLEIEADDVRCSHGATVGQVDASMLFYLMSRGLTRRQAERLLVFGFFDEVLDRMPVEGVRRRLAEAIEEKVGL